MWRSVGRVALRHPVLTFVGGSAACGVVVELHTAISATSSHVGSDLVVLPLEYEPDAIAAHWRRRPLQVCCCVTRLPTQSVWSDHRERTLLCSLSVKLSRNVCMDAVCDLRLFLVAFLHLLASSSSSARLPKPLPFMCVLFHTVVVVT